MSASNDSHLPSDSFFILQCSDSTVGRCVISTFSSTYILLVLPLSVFVLSLGVQQWRHQRSVSTAAAATSHSDFFTYNMAVVELIAVFGYVVYNRNINSSGLPVIPSVSVFIGFFTWPGQLLFPILTCVERYLAVVHPITYLGLRQAGGVRIRNLVSGCVWLMCSGGAGLMLLYCTNNLLPASSILIFLAVVMTFLSLSVRRVLIRPRPGEVGGDRPQVDRSKQRAAYTIMIIMVVLWLKFGGNVVAIAMTSSPALVVKCLGEASTFVFSLPNSLMLFLLFLHRAGKLPNCRHGIESG